MSGANILFIVLGAIAAVAGVGMLLTAIRGQPGERPRHTILLIAGMMATAFGMLMIAFAVTAATARPLSYGGAQ